MMNMLEDFKSEFIRIFEEDAVKQGYPSLIGKILAILYMEERGLSQKEISELTKHARSSINRGLDIMLRNKLVFRRTLPNSNSYEYFLKSDQKRLWVSWLEGLVDYHRKVLKELEELESNMNNAKKNYDSKINEKKEFNKLLKQIIIGRKTTEKGIKILKKALNEFINLINNN